MWVGVRQAGLVDVSLGILVKLVLAAGAAEIVRVAPVLRFVGSILGRHGHAANGTEKDLFHGRFLSSILGEEAESHKRQPARDPVGKLADVGGDQAGARRAPRSNWALMATMMVLNDINNAPTAGEMMIFQGASTPAARGRAMML